MEMTITHEFDGVPIEFEISFTVVESDPSVGIMGDGYEELTVDALGFMGATFVPQKTADTSEIESWIESNYQDRIYDYISNR